jgi:RNA polymerase sigma-70 factor (ECF subfamily)
MDEVEFRAFYEKTCRPLWGYLARASGSGSLADDLTQEAYLRLLRARLREASEEHRKNYLFKIATNLLRDHFRALKRRPVQLPELPDVRAHETEAGTDRRAVLQRDLGRALQELRPRERQLLWLGHVEGFSHKEIAQILGLRAGSVRLLIFRARRKLAALLEERGLAPENAS